MPIVNIEALVPVISADVAFARIADFASYSSYTDAVREITVTPVADDILDSTWSVNFRSGTLSWSERDHIDFAARTIRFDQIGGDFDTLRGGWSVNDGSDAVRIGFWIEFDMGMPSIAPIIDPIAERTLAENMTAILRGLFGDEVVVMVGAPDAAMAGACHDD